ncbi:hypothetical protein [Neobacillus niacini]|uniref:hypothetical protein n=1 Tax=Neobacillus niacini TaxID=86668 RepID=UPI0021CB0E3F|nr:hypothetical protein [Neobacillus niacini]MCM3764606.1 hypothetical protein [Neobacillus niacini]
MKNQYSFGEINLNVFGEENFNLETVVAGKLQLVLANGKSIELDICEVLHKNLKLYDTETDIEIVEELTY